MLMKLTSGFKVLQSTNPEVVSYFYLSRSQFKKGIRNVGLLFISVYIHFLFILSSFFYNLGTVAAGVGKKHPFHPHPFFYSFFLSRTRYLHLLGQLTLKRKVKVTAWIIADQFKRAMATRKAVWLFFLRNRPALLLHEKRRQILMEDDFFLVCSHSRLHVCSCPGQVYSIGR